MKRQGIPRNWGTLLFCFCILGFLSPRTATGEAARVAPFSPFFEASVGLGYIQPIGGITTIWTEGGEVELSFLYQFLSFFGVEAIGVIGFSGMTDSAKVTVSEIDAYGNISTESSNGGLYLNILLGPRFSFPISSSPVRSIVLSVGAGGFHYGQMETGIGAVDYQNRWTFGWGGYGAAGVHFRNNDSGTSWGFELRYLYSWANVNDFNSPNPPAYDDDQRIMLVVDARMRL